LLKGDGVFDMTKLCTCKFPLGMQCRISFARALLIKSDYLEGAELFVSLDTKRGNSLCLTVSNLMARQCCNASFISRDLKGTVQLGRCILLMQKRQSKTVEVIPIDLSMLEDRDPVAIEHIL